MMLKLQYNRVRSFPMTTEEFLKAELSLPQSQKYAQGGYIGLNCYLNDEDEPLASVCFQHHDYEVGNPEVQTDVEDGCSCGKDHNIIDNEEYKTKKEWLEKCIKGNDMRQIEEALLILCRIIQQLYSEEHNDETA